MDTKASVQQQFGRVAANYSVSTVHIGGPDLVAMLDAVPLAGDEIGLDVGTGTGHTALAFAPRLARMTAVDLTEPMLEQGRRLAAERGIANLVFEHGDAEALPFPDDTFDLVTCRYCAHHFPHPARAIAEVARVMKPNGTFLLVDVISPEDPATDTFLNAIEVMRDTSHIRDHSLTQWEAMFAAAGLTATQLGQWPLRLEFDTWIARMETPAPTAVEIQRLLEVAPAEARAGLVVEEANRAFSIPVALIQGRLRA